MNNFKSLLYSFLVASLSLWLLFGLADWIHPRLGCLAAERDFWQRRDEVFVFERVSSFYWSSLCSDNAKPVIISASEGTGELSFPEVALTYNVRAHEFTGAHRGLKTLAYLLANRMHEERLKNLRIMAFINPVYFSFAASTDSSTVRLTSISNLSYVLRIPSLHQKWDEFLFDSPFIGAKAYLDELRLFKAPGGLHLEIPGVSAAPNPALYDLTRNMLKEKAENFTSFRSPFTKERQPARFLFDQVVKFAKSHPNARICYVMLPTNTKNLRFFNREAGEIASDMSELTDELPQGTAVDLQYMNEEPYIFMDPMHLTDFGKERVMEEVMQTECAKRVFE